MPLNVDPETLELIIKPGLATRKDGECFIEVTSGEVQLHSRSATENVYFCESIPISTIQQPLENVPNSCWVNLEDIADFLTVNTESDLRFTLPFETADAEFILSDQSLTYRFGALNELSTHDPDPSPMGHTRTLCAIYQLDLSRSLQAADLLGDDMQIHIIPEANHIEFLASNSNRGESFTYTVPEDHIKFICGRETEFNVEIDFLNEMSSSVLDNSIISLVLSDNSLKIALEYPFPGSSLVVHLSRYLQKSEYRY